jgi:ectoine hydroxylase-related dioxygenase (phytanoyl-CoA dioxygenase family)
MSESYDLHGYFLLKDAFHPEELDAVEAAITPFEKAAEDALRTTGRGVSIAQADRITFTVHLVKHSPVLRQFSRHPVFQRLCADILGRNARLYWDQAVYKKPGNPEDFPWHQDNGYAYVEPQNYLTCWVPLTDATEDNGCPWVVPGLHKAGTFEHWPSPNGMQCLEKPDNAVAVPARKGDVVVFSSLTPHRTGPNLTTETRKTYVLQFAPDGAVLFPREGGAPMPQNDEERQYLIS